MLPWRKTKDPYKILVSEVMLQQTQVKRVIRRYEEFVKKFPDFPSLCGAPISSVIKIWSGLGYNRRALYLQKTAAIVQNKHKGLFPKDPKILETFPGIGKATACSILVFSFNMPLVFIETNVRRVFIYHFFKNNEQVYDKEILKLIGQTIDKKNPREWYWALMDYGSYLSKIVENPNRKSKHYSKQSKFECSLRQVRGNVLKILLEKKNTTKKSLKKIISSVYLDTVLDQLQKEGFIVVRKEIISFSG